MKNNKTFTTGLGIALGTVLFMALVSVLLSRFSSAFGQPDTKGLLFRLSLANILLAAAGMALLLLAGAKILIRLGHLEDLAQLLEEKNYPALGEIKPSGAYKELETSLRSLGKFYQILKTFSSQSAEARELIKAENTEHEAKAAHLGEVFDAAESRFGEIGSAAVHVSGFAGKYTSAIGSLNGNAAKQAELTAHAESRISEAAQLAGTISARIGESESQAEALKERVLAGEDQSRTAYDTIREAAGNLEKITDMAGVINQISEQTDLLSMNAAIESAHAGAAGAGFAVVANEIKKLAESTRENAESIQEAIKAINRRIAEALKASEASFETFSSITEKFGIFARTLTEIGREAQKSGDTHRETREAVRESAAIARKILDSGSEALNSSGSLLTDLEQIRSLSDMTRTELKEIRMGALESLEHIRKTQEKVRQTLTEAEDLGGTMDRNAVHGTVKADDSWRKDVAVKSPPRTVG
ncbi:MAG: methyl-accepting chemotaxis protein [Treponema sp.]|jgi:methyl-accepting chemotaxis protein|nr:methyl-accepting chemotaxis protein [Treponema sp.]